MMGILDHIKAGTMKALVLGHSFVRRLRDWMRDNDREISRGSLDVHLHGVGGRTVRQVYDLDLKRVERIHPDVVLLQLGGGGATSVAVPPGKTEAAYHSASSEMSGFHNYCGLYHL